MFRKSSFALLFCAALQSPAWVHAQAAPGGAVPDAAASSPVMAELLDLRSERSALLRGVELQESEISRLRALGDRAALKSAVAERNRLRGSLRAVNTTIRLLNSIAQAGGVQSPATSFDGALDSLRQGVAKSEAAFREAEAQLEQARASGSEAEIAKARRQLQSAAFRVRVATHAVEQLESRREQIVAVVESAAGGVPRELAGNHDGDSPPSDGSGDATSAVASAPIAIMELIADGASPVEEQAPASAVEEPAAPVQQTATPVQQVVEPVQPAEVPVQQTTTVAAAPVLPAEESPAMEPAPLAEEPTAASTESVAPAQEVAAVEEPAPVVAEASAPAEEIAAVEEPAPLDTAVDAVIAETLLQETNDTTGDPVTSTVEETLTPTPEEVADSTPLPIVEELPPDTTADIGSTPTGDTAPSTTSPEEIVTTDSGSGTSTSTSTSPSPEPVIAGYAVLRWTIPVTRANGAPLAISELRGYEVYVLSESTGERTVITIDDPLREEHRLDGLPPDTWHFAVAAIDTAGNASELSAVVSKTIADTSVASAP